MAQIIRNGKQPVRILRDGKPAATVVRNGTVLWPPYEYRMDYAWSTATLPAGGGSSVATARLLTLDRGQVVASETIVPVIRVVASGEGVTTDGTTLTAASRGTTLGDRRSIEVELSYTFVRYGREHTLTQACTLYQEANTIVQHTSRRWAVDQDNMATGFVLPASGGTRTGQLQVRFTYASGDTEDALIREYTALPAASGVFRWFTNASKVAVTAASRGTALGNALAESAVLTYRYKGFAFTDTSTYTQQGNYVTGLTPTIGTFRYNDIGAGDSQARPDVSFDVTLVFSSGAAERRTQAFSNEFGTLSGGPLYTLSEARNGFTAIDAGTGTLTAASRGAEIGNARESADATLDVSFRYIPKAPYHAAGTIQSSHITRTARCRQAGNYVTRLTLTQNRFQYPRIGPDATDARPVANHTATYTFSSGTTSATTPAGGTFTPSVSHTLDVVQNGFTEIRSATGQLTATRMGTILGKRASGTVTRTLSGEFVHDAAYAAGGTVTAPVTQKTAVCEQGMNRVVTVEADTDFRYTKIGPAATEAPATVSGYAMLTYASGATQQTDRDNIAGLHLTLTRTFALLEVKNGFTAVDPATGRLTASNMGAVLGSRTSGTVRSTLNVTVTHTDASLDNPQPGTATRDATCVQGDNAVVSYDPPRVNQVIVEDIPAGGGTVSSGLIKFNQTAHYLSGVSDLVANPLAVIRYENAVQAPSLGINLRNRAKVGTLRVTVTANGHSTAATADVYQAANAVTAISAVPKVYSGGIPFPASGGQATIGFPMALTYTSGAVRTNEEGVCTNRLYGAHADYVPARDGSPSLQLDQTYMQGNALTTRVSLRGEGIQAMYVGYALWVHFTDGTESWLPHYEKEDVPERGTFEKTYRFTDHIEDKPLRSIHLCPIMRSPDGTTLSGTLSIRHEFAGLGTEIPEAWSAPGGGYTDIGATEIHATGGPIWLTVSRAQAGTGAALLLRALSRGTNEGPERTGNLMATAFYGELSASTEYLLSQAANTLTAEEMVLTCSPAVIDKAGGTSTVTATLQRTFSSKAVGETDLTPQLVLTPAAAVAGFTLAGNVVTAQPNSATDAPARAFAFTATVGYEGQTYEADGIVMQESNREQDNTVRIRVGQQEVYGGRSIQLAPGEYPVLMEFLYNGSWASARTYSYSASGTGLRVWTRPPTLVVERGASGKLIIGALPGIFGTATIYINS